jgi:thiamine-monophosphate kinase
MLAQGVHFDLAWSDPASLGRKSLAVNLSDIAAMGGIPRYALLSLAIPAELPLEFMESFMHGFLEQAQRYDVFLIGGDTSASKAGLVINVTLLGEQYLDRISKRSGACSGDMVCVSGTPGDAALGLDLLRKGSLSGEAVKRHLDPVPRVELGRLLAERNIPSAMIDISDGLHADLGHILESSSKGARICVDDLPLSDYFRECVPKSSPNYYRFPLSGGEDYELLFTLHPSKLKDAECAASITGTSISVIGEITEETGLFLAFSDGSRYDAELHCYDHFA